MKNFSFGKFNENIKISSQPVPMFRIIVFAQLGVITSTRNQFVKIVTVAQCYFFIQPCKKYGIKEVSAPNIRSHKIS